MSGTVCNVTVEVEIMPEIAVFERDGRPMVETHYTLGGGATLDILMPAEVALRCLSLGAVIAAERRLAVDEPSA